MSEPTPAYPSITETVDDLHRRTIDAMCRREYHVAQLLLTALEALYRASSTGGRALRPEDERARLVPLIGATRQEFGRGQIPDVPPHSSRSVALPRTVTPPRQASEPTSWQVRPIHPTCVDASTIDEGPGTTWVCGPDCPNL